MRFYSTKNKSYLVDLQTAVLSSLPPDNGLYMPESIDRLPESFLESYENLSFQEISFVIASTLIKGSLPEDVLHEIINTAINFPAPLKELEKDIYTLELWHGPSLAFKDFGARFMAGLMSYLVRGENRVLDILVATSGDTGGAVAAGFLGVPNINVSILYPSGKVSPLQELQLTTLGQNITAFEVNGTFDDCQELVKAAFLDKDLNERRKLSSANSINIARLIPQSFYYYEAAKQLKDKSKPIVFSVPSGNFGNLTAGLIAKRMGLKVAKFLAATNLNNIVPHYLATSNYIPRTSIQSISNAMDVGKPSNFQRILDLYDADWQMIAKDIEGYYYTDEDTEFAIKYIDKSYDYTADPHGAVGFMALHQHLQDNPGHQGIFLETAHPAKFLPVMQPLLDKIDVPLTLSSLSKKNGASIVISKEFSEFKSRLLD